MLFWESLKASMKPTDDADYKRRITRGFISGAGVGSFFGAVSTVWVKAPYRTDIQPTTIAQSTRMVVRPAVVLALCGFAYEAFGTWVYTIRGKKDWWTNFVAGASAGAVAGISTGKLPNVFKLSFFVGALTTILETCRGYHGIGATVDERYWKRSQVIPDPVPRSEMEH